MSDLTVTELLQEYFQLKERDKAIRKVRNAFMQDNHCLNLDRPTKSYKDQSDYEENGGECIRREVGMGGYPAPSCEVCEKRSKWYTERQRLSHRRSAIMRMLKHRVTTPNTAKE